MSAVMIGQEEMEGAGEQLDVRKTEKSRQEMQEKRLHRLRDRMVIVSYTAPRYCNSVKDTAVRDEVAEEKDAEQDMLSVSKKVLTKETLKMVSSAHSKVQGMFRVPKDGARRQAIRYGICQWSPGEILVPIERIPAMQAEFNALQAEVEQALTDIEPHWDAHIQNAAAAAGDLHDALALPSFADFAAPYRKMKMSIRQLPDSDPRYTLDEWQFEDIRNQMREEQERELTEALSRSWKSGAENLLRAVEYTTAVLGNDAGAVAEMNGQEGKARKSERTVKITEALFESLNTQLDTTEALARAAEDADMLEMVRQSRATLGELTPEYLRKNPAERERAAGSGRRLVEKLKKGMSAVTGSINEARAENGVEELDDTLSVF